jgi:hypothetical protein
MNLDEARASGATRYQSDNPCCNGHENPERFTANQACCACHRALVSFGHYSHKEADKMIPVNEQMRSMQEQIEVLKDMLGREPAPPPKRVPSARCTSQAFSVARLVDGKLGRLFDDGHTKVSVVEAARKMAVRYDNPIRYIDWQTDLNDVSGSDAICIIERVHCTDDDGGSGRVPVTKWEFANNPPAWLKFGGTSEVFA